MKLYRPVTILVGIALVIIAGLIRLGEPDQVYEDVSRYAVRGGVGQTIKGRDFELTVTRVKFARELDPRRGDSTSTSATPSPEDQPIRTNGIFVTVDYQVLGKNEEGSAGGATLTADGGSTYVPVNRALSSSIAIPPPGFIESASLVFETNPDDLVGLTLWAKKLRGLSVTTEDYAIDLGIPDEAIAKDMIAKAEKLYPLREATRRAAS